LRGDAGISSRQHGEGGVVASNRLVVEHRVNLYRFAPALLGRETLDADEACAAAGIERTRRQDSYYETPGQSGRHHKEETA
jgi:hypothetical protein